MVWPIAPGCRGQVLPRFSPRACIVAAPLAALGARVALDDRDPDLQPSTHRRPRRPRRRWRRQRTGAGDSPARATRRRHRAVGRRVHDAAALLRRGSPAWHRGCRARPRTHRRERPCERCASDASARLRTGPERARRVAAVAFPCRHPQHDTGADGRGHRDRIHAAQRVHQRADRQ